MTGPERQNESDVEAEFSAAIRLLREGLPQNGINLVPRWEKLLASEQAFASDQKPGIPPTGGRSFFPGIRLSGWLQVAAILAMGVGVGSIATGWMGAHGGSPMGSPMVLIENQRHYTDQQRDLMFLVLSSATPPPRDVVLKATRELVACVTCHESGVKDRLISWQP